ncbi:MAG: hypothetical protein P4L84_04415 [Isosphaeraceae bacterium]|nr:hypothetical protein [Isosphaeraceae bacterium]
MIRGFRWVPVAVVLVLIPFNEVCAQISIDTRGLGFGGWNGNLFQSPGQDRALDVQTAMNLNEYIFQCQMQANKRQHELMLRRQKRVNDTMDSMIKRLRTNPTESDVAKGDALNVAFDDITNPKAYAKALQAAKAKPFAGTKIKSIPFRYASAAITTSIDNLTEPANTPAILNGPEFKEDLTALRKLETEFKAKSEADSDKAQTIDPAPVNKAKSHIKKMTETLKKNEFKYKKGSADLRQSENYLKGLYVVVTMLDSPSMTRLLAGVEKRDDTTVSDLLRFMHSSNLRFGVAKAGEQQEIYTELFGILDELRNQLGGPRINPLPPDSDQKPTPPPQLFAGMDRMDFSQLDLLRLLPPLPDELKKKLPPPPPGLNRLPPPPPPFKP